MSHGWTYRRQGYLIVQKKKKCKTIDMDNNRCTRSLSPHLSISPPPPTPTSCSSATLTHPPPSPYPSTHSLSRRPDLRVYTRRVLHESKTLVRRERDSLGPGTQQPLHEIPTRLLLHLHLVPIVNRLVRPQRPHRLLIVLLIVPIRWVSPPTPQHGGKFVRRPVGGRGCIKSAITVYNALI